MGNRVVVVTGATGAVGPAVVLSLREGGFLVRTLSLHVPQAGMFPGDVEVRLGDITDPETVKCAVEGADAVVHLAALLHIVNPPPSMRERYGRVNVGGTATLVAAADEAGVRRLVLFSTIAVYGASGGQVLTEDTPPVPDSFYAETKLAAEKIVLGARRRDGEHLGVVLRLAAVYGSRIKGNYRQLLRMLSRRRFVPLGAGMNRRTLVYDRDVGLAACLALEHPGAGGRIYNVSDGEFHPMKEIITTMCAALHRRAPRIAVPVGPARFAAGLLEDVARVVGRRSPIVRSTIDKYTEDVAVSSRRIQAELGFVPKYDLATGWRETVEEMRQRGEL